MTATTISRLAYHVPDEDIRSVTPDLAGEVAAFPGDSQDSESCRLLPGYERSIAKFSLAYRELAYGWKVATYFARHHQPFPGVFYKEDSVVYQAYLAQCNFSYATEAIKTAYSIAGEHSRRHTKWTLQAALIDKEATLENVSDNLKLPPSVVSTYEKLFFNVLDRKKDATFLAQTVYPDTRLVEMFDRYLNREGLGELLLRAGYNNGIKDVLYMAGFGGDLLAKLGSENPSMQLEARIMGNGFLLARNGWLNQRTDATGIIHAKGVLQSAKMAGEQNSSNQPSFATLGSSLKISAIRLSTGEVTARFEALNAGGPVIEG